MPIDLKTFDNRFNVEFGSDGKCKKCGNFHKLSTGDKLIADCNGNFDPSKHEEYVNTPKDPKDSMQTLEPIVLEGGETGEPFEFEVGKKYKSRTSGFVGTYMILSNEVCESLPVLMDLKTKEARVATDSTLWMIVEPKKLHCEMDGKELRIFGEESDSENNYCVFVKLTKKEVIALKKLRCDLA